MRAAGATAPPPPFTHVVHGLAGDTCARAAGTARGAYRLMMLQLALKARMVVLIPFLK
jgi:hypothetical protein